MDFPGMPPLLPPQPPMPAGGLLGNFQGMDPQKMGLLAAAFKGLQASGPSRTPVSLGQTIGMAGEAGMDAMRQGTQDQLKNRAFDMQAQMHGVQMQEHALKLRQAMQQQEYLNNFENSLPADEKAKFRVNPTEYIKNLYEDKFAKIDPTKYTPESVKAFAASRKHADLVPRDEIVADILGGTTQYRTKYSLNPLGTSAHTLGPDTAARLAWDQYQHNNPSAYQQAELGNQGIKIGLDRANTFFNTGMGPMGGGAGVPRPAAPFQMPTAGSTPQMPNAAPQVASASQPRPMTPTAAPNPAPVAAPLPPAIAPAAPLAAPLAPGLTPKIAAEVAGEKAKMEGKRDFNMTGINDALDTAEKILKGEGPTIGGIKTNAPKPTQSGIGNIYDTVAGFFGASPNGAKEADQLRSIGGSLVAKMPRMEGPQSDKDVALYTQMAGMIGDASVPVERRLAALQTVRDLYAKYEKPQTSTPTAPMPASKQFNVDGKGVIGKLEPGTNKYFVMRGGKKFYIEE